MNNMLSLFPNFLTTDSIFQKMVPLGAPWSQSVGQSMDMTFFTMYSGMKLPTYFVRSQLSSTGTVSSQQIAQVLWNMFGRNWEKLWDGYVLQYNPLDSYNMKETVTREQTDDRDIKKNGSFDSTVNGTDEETYSDESTSTVTQNSTGSSEGTNTLQHGHVVDTSRTINDFTYGFNSAEQVPTAVQSQSGQDTNSGTDTTTTTDSTTSESKTDTTSSDSGKRDLTHDQTRSDTNTETTNDNNTTNESIDRTRSGNVGNSSYQELLTEEFELWKWNFFFQVFDDCDRLLCLSTFSQCCDHGGLLNGFT